MNDTTWDQICEQAAAGLETPSKPTGPDHATHTVTAERRRRRELSIALTSLSLQCLAHDVAESRRQIINELELLDDLRAKLGRHWQVLTAAKIKAESGVPS